MHLLETADSSHAYYGQQVYILGFPHGHDSGGEEINLGLPIPFVKSGIISAFAFGDVKKIYIDTHANEGFSGGPVVFHPQQGARDPHELRVAGVVTGYIYHNRVLNDADGNHWGSVRENTGIAVAVGVQHATDLIDANQTGSSYRPVDNSKKNHNVPRVFEHHPDGILEDEHAESALVLDTNPPVTGIACRQKGWPARCFVPVE